MERLPGRGRPRYLYAATNAALALMCCRSHQSVVPAIWKAIDHVGGRGILDSWRLLAPGGTLVSYGSASTRDVGGSKMWPVLKLVGRLMLWNALPNGRHAYFFNVWAGARRKDSFRARLRADLTEVLDVLRRGDIDAPIAARMPLARVAEAMRLAESGTVAGKVILTP